MNSKNRYALVTGATSAVGYELAKLLARDGYNLVITSRDEKMVELKAKEFEQAFGVDVITIVTDLFEGDAPFALYDKIKSKGITIESW